MELYLRFVNGNPIHTIITLNEHTIITPDNLSTHQTTDEYHERCIQVAHSLCRQFSICNQS